MPFAGPVASRPFRPAAALSAATLSAAALLLALTTAPVGAAERPLAEAAAGLRGEASALAEAAGAARVQLAQSELSSAQAAQFDRRISALEKELRGLTGRLEDLDFRISQQRQNLERLESETKARLLRLEQGETGTGAGSAPAQTGQSGPATSYTPPGGSGETVVGQAPEPQATGPSQSSGSAQPGPLEPRNLGTITDDDLAAVQGAGDQTGGNRTAGAAAVQPPVTDEERQGAQNGTQGGPQTAAAVQLPQDDPQAAYDTAFDQLRQMNYPAAESAFSEFLQLYPDNRLAGNAKYWLGETYYVRGDYETAAVVFAEGYQDFPDSGKAPDNLLKLGMSLANLGSTQDACATFGELQRRYPNAAPTILQRASRESSRLGC
jgi:tol-pal system protein YbgF